MHESGFDAGCLVCGRLVCNMHHARLPRLASNIQVQQQLQHTKNDTPCPACVQLMLAPRTVLWYAVSTPMHMLSAAPQGLQSHATVSYNVAVDTITDLKPNGATTSNTPWC